MVVLSILIILPFIIIKIKMDIIIKMDIVIKMNILIIIVILTKHEWILIIFNLVLIIQTQKIPKLTNYIPQTNNCLQ